MVKTMLTVLWILMIISIAVWVIGLFSGDMQIARIGVILVGLTSGLNLIRLGFEWKKRKTLREQGRNLDEPPSGSGQ